MASLAAIGTARLLAPGDDVLSEAAFTAVKVGFVHSVASEREVPNTFVNLV